MIAGGTIVTLVFFAFLLTPQLSGFSIFEEKPDAIGTLFEGQVTISFDANLADELRAHWREHPDTEYAACLDGTRTMIGKNMTEQFDTMDFRLTSATYNLDGKTNYVSVPPCDRLAVLHSHPEGSCQETLGVSDIEAAKTLFRDGAAFFMIQCEENLIEVYSRDNLYEGALVTLE